MTAYAQTDGPAQLPTRVPVTTITAPNAPKTVAVTDNLQAMLSAAVAGDTFLVDPAYVWTGALTFPNVTSCTPALGISVQSGGTIIEDAKHRPVTAQQFPKIILKGSQTVTLGSCIEIYGLEITRAPGTGTWYNALVAGSTVHDVVLDHVYVHGTPTDESVRGLFLPGATGVAVLNSVFREFHCKALGTCGDTQTISFGLSDGPTSGSFLFRNNDLQSSGENIIGGGGPDTVSPTDVTIEYNDITKPDSWNPLSPTYGGYPWITKNLVEFKNCVRCLVQGNNMSGSWGGYSQIGFAVLIGAKNQNGACPACAVTDIVIRNNWINHAGPTAQIMVAPTPGLNVYAAETGRISVHDNVVTDPMYPECYGCGKWAFQVSSSTGAPLPLHDVSIIHNTISVSRGANDGGFLNLGGPPSGSGTQMFNISITDNVFPGGKYPIYSTGGGASNCAVSGSLNYATMLSGCFVSSSFTSNVVLLGDSSTKITWPAGNTIVGAGANVSGVKSALGSIGTLP
jgi:hypothetical protein